MYRAVLRLWGRKKLLPAAVILLLSISFCLYLLFHLPSIHQHAGVDSPDSLIQLSRKEQQQHEAHPLRAEKKRTDVSYNVFTFYYTWYGNKKFNDKFIHWGHPRLPHWNKMIGRGYSTDVHVPPEDIGANYYPEIGLYSFLDSSAIETHFDQIRSAGIGVVVVSWYPPHMADDQGVPTHYIVPRLLHFAAKFRLKIALHIEPYARRDVVNLRRHIRLLNTQNITSHSAYLHRNSKPVFFVYDSYRTDFRSWARLLTKAGDLSIVGTSLNAFFVGLYFRDGDCNRFADTGFEGAYSYFGVDGLSAGSRIKDWKSIRNQCSNLGVDFIPCVAPGYDDTAVRPWNADNVRERENGKYYRQMFEAAINSGASSIAITSFNEWHEGTQIEPAIPKTVKNFPRKYADYLPNPPDFYIHLTRALVDKFLGTQIKS